MLGFEFHFRNFSLCGGGGVLAISFRKTIGLLFCPGKMRDFSPFYPITPRRQQLHLLTFSVVENHLQSELRNPKMGSCQETLPSAAMFLALLPASIPISRGRWPDDLTWTPITSWFHAPEWPVEAEKLEVFFFKNKVLCTPVYLRNVHFALHFFHSPCLLSHKIPLATNIALGQVMMTNTIFLYWLAVWCDVVSGGVVFAFNWI